MAQKTKRVVLRCYAYAGKNNEQEGWYAACIDLGIVTWRPTLQEAKKSLNDAMIGYVQSVNNLIREGKDTEHLIPRRAPFWPYYFGYYVARVINFVPNLNHALRSISFKQSVDVNLNAVTV